MRLQLISEMDKNLPIYASSQILSKKISEILEDRFSKSQKLKNCDGTLLIYLFFNYDVKDNPDIENRGCLYIGKDKSVETSMVLESFYVTSSSALTNNIVELPSDITSVVIYYSQNVIDKADVLKSKEGKVSFNVTKPKYTFDDVIINDDERRSIFRALIMIKEKELAFDKWGYRKIDPATKSILCFHGAPGTGKTMCAHAVAQYLGKNLLIARYSQIQSKYTGEGEKNLRKYFEEAEKQDAVLFIDEADTFLSKRLSSSNSNSKIYNSMSNELYQLIEDYNGCIIFASNHIADFDPAVISRIIEPVEFKLPDKETRIKIIKKLLPPNIPMPIPLCEIDLEKLSSISEGFSGRDIRKSMYVFIADKLYEEKQLKRKKDNDIVISFNDIMVGFEEVKKSKDKLNEATKNTNKKIGDFLKEEEKKLRLIQIAALALWSDGEISPKEKQLFDELSKQFKIDIQINAPEKLPTLEDICSRIHTKSEKIQAVDITCRMIAFDLNYPLQEKLFVQKLLDFLGYDKAEFSIVDKYINELITNYQTLELISSHFEISCYDALHELMKEYTEPAANFHLAELYQKGSDKFGGINVDEAKAAFYFNEAKKMGFIHR